MANDVSKTVGDKIRKSLSDSSGFGGESGVKFDGLRLTKLTPEDTAKMTKRKKAAMADTSSDSKKKDSGTSGASGKEE